jgi:hypothetical protein
MFVVEWALSVSLFGIFLFYSAWAYVTEIEGLKRKLTSKLGANSPALVPDWQVTFLGYLQLQVLTHEDDFKELIPVGVNLRRIWLDSWKKIKKIHNKKQKQNASVVHVFDKLHFLPCISWW